MFCYISSFSITILNHQSKDMSFRTATWTSEFPFNIVLRFLILRATISVHLVLPAFEEVLIRPMVDVVKTDNTLNGFPLNQATQHLNLQITLNSCKAQDLLHPIRSNDDWIFNFLFLFLPLGLVFMDKLHDTVGLDCITDIE